MSKTVAVHRAGDVGDHRVDPCTLVIGDSIQFLVHRQLSMNECKVIYDADAKAIVETLVTHLPQATLERVLGQLMLHKANQGIYIGIEKS